MDVNNWSGYAAEYLDTNLDWALLVLLLTTSTAPAQDWAKNMFKHTSHDFGTVARGQSRASLPPGEHLSGKCSIASAHVSCGCTTLEIPTQIVKTWDKAEVIARVNTLAHLGQKDVTITVVFDKPFPAEVQLHTHCYIRSDVVVQPGAVPFGTIGKAPRARKVTVSYAGRNDWRIQSVECANPSLSFQALSRSPAAEVW